MYARVNTLRLDPSKLDDMVAQFRERDLPAIEAMEGFKGFTTMVDRESGTALATSYWESADAERASAEKVKEARRRAEEAGGASGETDVAVYEVVLDTMA